MFGVRLIGFVPQVFLVSLLLSASGSLAQESRVEIESRNFSIIPPPDWKVIKDQVGTTLFMEPYDLKGEPYKRHIQVRYGQQSYSLDKYTADPYSKKLVSERSRSLPGDADYKVTSHSLVNIADGSPAMVFYAEFKLGGLEMMELHLLVSATDGHFLLTFTDIAEHFQDDGSGSILDKAYNSMISTKLGSYSSGRFDSLYYVGGGLGVLVVLFSFLRFVQGRHKFSEEDVEGSLESDSEEFMSRGHKLESELQEERSRIQHATSEVHRLEQEIEYHSDVADTWHDDVDEVS